MEYLSGEVIAGVFATIAGAAVILQRIGILKIPTTKKDKPDNPKGDESEKITVLEKVQGIQAEILKRHDEQFARGNKRFDGLEEDIGNININVGVLLERTK